ncbi:tetratricopeptide repeat protein [Bacteriovorax sp. Seq25_V]|uniref:tetratricopeptide repeat protein n=1 Tax=Bacteriovorax sp. Seq25_V TaxID=1201288 RepID=UPI00038A31CC|nr:tetratricopeptide repeat protein [Bacteriovorax sp. Seq25_V]EQC48061.1 tetratricopeptide repeat protein [Bacteriovorax sp. Seq25_V]
MNSAHEILLSELIQAKSYIDRLFHAITDLSSAFHRAEIRTCASNLTEELEQIVKTKFVSTNYNDTSLIHREHIKTAKTNFKNLCLFVEVFLKLSPNKANIINDMAAVINCIYKHGKELHELTAKFANIDVQLPRTSLIREVKTETAFTQKQVTEVKKFGRFSLLEGGRQDIEDEEEMEEDLTPVLFQLDIEKVKAVVSDNKTSLLGLESKREEKYEESLSLGHKAAYQKDHELALEHFLKAKSFKDTAEVNTLVAWIYTLLGEPEKAKSLCLRAISLDPDFGPAYNDLGSILLNEGSIEEALKWFELAKKAIKYQNKEFPYINAGRAYMMVHNYEKAIIEFEQAIEISPDNEELIETVEKIKLSFEKERATTRSQFFTEHPEN